MGSDYYEIDLAPYGRDGKIVMCSPGFGRMLWMQDFKKDLARKGEDMSDMSDLRKAVISSLQFVKSAPFDITDVDAFFAFISEVDDFKPQKGAELVAAIMETSTRIFKESEKKDPLDP